MTAPYAAFKYTYSISTILIKKMSATCSARRCSQASCRAFVLVDTDMYWWWRPFKKSNAPETSCKMLSHCDS